VADKIKVRFARDEPWNMPAFKSGGFVVPGEVFEVDAKTAEALCGGDEPVFKYVGGKPKSATDTPAADSKGGE
jgi:hypothetical protein